jgi:hypothetical protein
MPAIHKFKRFIQPYSPPYDDQVNSLSTQFFTSFILEYHSVQDKAMNRHERPVYSIQTRQLSREILMVNIAWEKHTFIDVLNWMVRKLI